MAKYVVTVKVTEVETYEIEADSPEEAREKYESDDYESSTGETVSSNFEVERVALADGEKEDG